MLSITILFEEVQVAAQFHMQKRLVPRGLTTGHKEITAGLGGNLS